MNISRLLTFFKSIDCHLYLMVIECVVSLNLIEEYMYISRCLFILSCRRYVVKSYTNVRLFSNSRGLSVKRGGGKSG